MSQNKKKNKNDQKITLSEYLTEIRKQREALKKAKISKKKIM